MNIRSKAFNRLLVLPCLLGFMLPASLRAQGTMWTYTGNALSTSYGTFQVSITLDTLMTLAQVESLPANTDISGSLTGSFSMSPGGAWPNHDQAGFPIGGSFGSAYFQMTNSPTVKIGTDASGDITSWNITQTLFASYPAVPGENPGVFFATYTISSTTAGDQGILVTDNDAGFAPPSTGLAERGVWSGPSVLVPEPSSFALAGLGLLVIVGLRRWRQAGA